MYNYPWTILQTKPRIAGNTSIWCTARSTWRRGASALGRRVSIGGAVCGQAARRSAVVDRAVGLRWFGGQRHGAVGVKPAVPHAVVTFAALLIWRMVAPHGASCHRGVVSWRETRYGFVSQHEARSSMDGPLSTRLGFRCRYTGEPLTWSAGRRTTQHVVPTGERSTHEGLVAATQYVANEVSRLSSLPRLRKPRLAAQLASREMMTRSGFGGFIYPEVIGGRWSDKQGFAGKGNEHVCRVTVWQDGSLQI